MKIEQIIKILKVALTATAIMLAFEIVFSINAVNDFFGGLIENAGSWTYVVIWLIMFLQVTVLNIPAYTVLSACASIGIETLSWQYILVVLSAYMTGCILAYWLGRWFGVKAVRWCAGGQEDFDKWSGFINKKGKWWYFLTVLFPFFPDDLLCIVAGSVKFNFGYYTAMNFVGRGIGLVSTILALKLLSLGGGDFPFMVIVWAVALVSEIIALIVLQKKYKKIDKKS